MLRSGIQVDPPAVAQESYAAGTASFHRHNIALRGIASSTKYIRYGIDQARRAWLTADDVVNTRSLADLRRLLKR